MAEVFHNQDSRRKPHHIPGPRSVPYKYLLILLVAALFDVLLADYADALGKRNILNSQTVLADQFRRHSLSEQAVPKMRNLDPGERGAAAGAYILDHWNRSSPSRTLFGGSWRGDWAADADSFWRERPAWKEYREACDAIWEDVVYFPVPDSVTHDYTVSYVDSWMGERTFGGTRGHEGTDLMASEDRPGLYPVVSMTPGTVTSKGWLPKGGYRIGILAPSGGYFYYAHLDSYADVREGDEVEAGDILGFMGDSGYGPEGTTGMFATHLHVGIYLYPDGRETSINPYWILRVIEEKKLSCSF